MMDVMYQHGEKVEQMETKIDKMKHGFNKVVCDFQETTNLITGIFTDNIQDRLKETKNALASITQKLKDQDDTITLLK
jgi:hypothetical protein